MAQAYSYQRCYEINNSPDDYTHIAIGIRHERNPWYWRRTLLNASHRDSYFKCKNYSEVQKFCHDPNIDVYNNIFYRPGGYYLEIYPIRQAAPEFLKEIEAEDPNATNSWNRIRRYNVPMNSNDIADDMSLEHTPIAQYMSIFITESNTFQVKLMRTIEKQFDKILASQINIQTDGSVRIFDKYDINTKDYEEWMIAM